MGIFVRGTRLWCRHKDETGHWQNRKTPYFVGQEDLAERYFRAINREIDSRRAAGLSGPLTVRAFADRFCDERDAVGLATAHDDRQRLRDHILPVIGDLLLDEVRPKHLRNLVMDLRKKQMAPRTIRNIHGVVSAMFRVAVTEEVLAASPCILPRGTLPPIQDKDPEWRSTAIFGRGELTKLISSPAILPDRRVMYALKGIAGMRHGEAAALRWSHYDPTKRPLGSLAVTKSKTKVQRLVPVHPALARLLDAWHSRGWEATYGRPPRDSDLIAPTRWGNRKAASEAQRAFLGDLEALKMRGRRGHDLRRTFISLAQEDGAVRDILKLATHGAPKTVMDLYTTFSWRAICAEVSKLRISIRGRISMPPLHGRYRPENLKAFQDVG